MFFFFFFKQKTAYEMRISDWSSDVCSSDLLNALKLLVEDSERAGEADDIEQRAGEQADGGMRRKSALHCRAFRGDGRHADNPNIRASAPGTAKMPSVAHWRMRRSSIRSA